MKIEHVALYVEDLERAKDFFETWFQATSSAKYHNPKRQFSSYFLSFDDGSRLELMHLPHLADLSKENRTGLAHLCFSLGSKEAVNQLTHDLQEAGYSLVSGPRTTGDGYYESCILDGEGNQIELTI
ncbi:MAG: glyoxalase [Allobaculum sp.]|nr:glyoxalase [Allobaculum sp.]MDE5758855.1 VOC family protein [Allobaculum sp.]